MPSVNIFKYPTRKTAVLVTGKERTNNMPLQNSKIKVYKGANIPLDFNIFDADGKPLVMTSTNTHLDLKVYDTHTQRIVFVKRLEPVVETSVTKTDTAGALTPSARSNNYKRTIYRTIVQIADIIDLPAGTNYRWVVMEQDTMNNTGYFYSGLDHMVEGELEITNNAAPQVELSIELPDSTTWTNTTRPDNMDSAIVGDNDNVYAQGWQMFTSSAIPGDAQLNIINGLHTIAFYANQFSGVVQVQACLEAEVPDTQSQHRWFNVPLSNGQVNTTFMNHSGVEAINFVGNFIWLRVVVYQHKIRIEGTDTFINSGKLTKVLVRR